MPSTPSTSGEVADLLVTGLEGESREFARLIIESDTTFEWDEQSKTLSYTCSEGCSGDPPRFPVTRQNGTVAWLTPERVGTDELDRSPLGRLVIRY